MPTPSPFPGMDPWLERYWGDIHHGLIQYARDQLTPALPEGLYAVVERTVYLLEESADSHPKFMPDVMVLEEDGALRDASSSQTTSVLAGVARPVRIAYESNVLRVGHIEIRDATAEHRVVTAIEVLSPGNKSGAGGRRQYTRKRDAYAAAGTHVVEIDLLRAGPTLVDLPPGYLSKHPEHVAPYKCVVRRAGSPGWTEIDYYPIALQERLPRIAVPLRPVDRDVALDLQSPLDTAYAFGRYGSHLNYAQPPDPPLARDDATWAHSILTAAGRIPS